MRSISTKFVFAKTINDLDSHLPKRRSDCFDMAHGMAVTLNVLNCKEVNVTETFPSY